MMIRRSIALALFPVLAFANGSTTGHGNGNGHRSGHNPPPVNRPVHPTPRPVTGTVNSSVNNALTNSVTNTNNVTNAVSNDVNVASTNINSLNQTATGGNATAAGGSATVTANPVATSTATGGAGGSASSTAAGGAGGTATATAGSAQSSSGGNSQSTSFNSPRQAPAVMTAPPTIVGCGAGGSAGGSNSGGAAVLGVSFVTAECHGWTLASAYAALGERKAACEVLNTQRSAKRAAARGATLPDCNNLTTIAVPVVENKNYETVIKIYPEAKDGTAYTKEEVAEIESRMMKALSK